MERGSTIGDFATKIPSHVLPFAKHAEITGKKGKANLGTVLRSRDQITIHIGKEIFPHGLERAFGTLTSTKSKKSLRKEVRLLIESGNARTAEEAANLGQKRIHERFKSRTDEPLGVQYIEAWSGLNRGLRDKFNNSFIKFAQEIGIRDEESATLTGELNEFISILEQEQRDLNLIEIEVDDAVGILRGIGTIFEELGINIEGYTSLPHASMDGTPQHRLSYFFKKASL